MESYREGLNYVPLLAQHSTPPCSGRSRISLGTKRSHHSLICYNGNYEGDSSMFREKLFELEHLSLADTESDVEKDATARSSLIREKRESCSLVERFVKFLMLQFLKPEQQEMFRENIEKVKQSFLYGTLQKCWKFMAILLSYIFYVFIILFKQFQELCKFFWLRRGIFRNLTRRLLWWLTLAKSCDTILFLMILGTMPILVILSVLGLVISLCGGLRDFLYYRRYLKRNN